MRFSNFKSMKISSFSRLISLRLHQKYSFIADRIILLSQRKIKKWSRNIIKLINLAYKIQKINLKRKMRKNNLKIKLNLTVR